MRVSASPHSKLGLYAASIIQNDMECTRDELNDWYRETGKLIKETENHFESVIKQMEALRKKTVRYIKDVNE
jgi:hypothetical protein